MKHFFSQPISPRGHVSPSRIQIGVEFSGESNEIVFNMVAVVSFKQIRLKPVAQRHQMVSGSLALLLFIGLDIPLGSRAAALIGDEVL